MMMKKITAAVILSAMMASAIPASAYDEDAAMQYLENCTLRYSSVQELENDSVNILTELKDKYECETEEAEELYNNLAERIKSKDKDANKSDDADKNENLKPDDNKTDEKALKKKTPFMADVLSQLSVFDKESFDFFKNVTRGDFAIYTANLVNYGQDYSKETGYYNFSDVTVDNECYSAVASLINKGAVTGVGEGIYAPNDEITLHQACSIVMRILGYDSIDSSQGKNEKYYYQRALENNITKGITASGNEVISGEDAVILLYNLLDSKCVKRIGTDKYTVSVGFMESFLGLDVIEGIVTSNSVTSLYSAQGAVGEGNLKINEILYRFGDLKPVAELDAMLGKKVKVYYSIDDSDVGKVITILDDYNEYFNITSNDIERYDEAANRLYYSDNGRLKYQEIPMSAKVIFNGEAVDYTHDKKLMFEPDAGEITFIKNDRGNEWNVIIINSYVYYESAAINASKPTLYDNMHIQPDLELDKNEVEIIKDGETVPASELPAGAIIMAAASRVEYRNGIMYPDIKNSKHIILEIISNEVTGKVTGTDEETVKIDDTEYTMSKFLTKLSKTEQDNKSFKIPPVGAVVTAELDKYGMVICFNVGSYSDGVQYGYIVKLIHDEDNEKYTVKLFTQDGQMIRATLKDKVKVHKKWGDGDLSEDTYYGMQIKAEKLAVIDSGTLNPQIVKFAYSDTNEIGEIYLADSTYTKTTAAEVGKKLDFYVGDKDIFEKDFSNVNGQSLNYYDLIYWYRVNEGNNNGTYFVIPTDTAAGDDEYKAYKTTITALPNGKWSDMEFYDVSETGNVGLVVRYVTQGGKTGKVENATTAVVAKKPVAVYDTQKDEISYSINLYANKKISRIWTQGEFQDYTFVNPDMVSYTISSEGYENLSNVPITSLKPGDLLRISLDSETGKISGFCVLARNLGIIDPETGKPELACLYPTISVSDTTITNDTGSSLWQYAHVTKGFVEKCVGESTFYVNDGSQYFRKLTIGDNTYSRDKVVIYDKSVSKNPVSEATPSDVRKGDYVISAFDETLIIVRNYK